VSPRRSKTEGTADGSPFIGLENIQSWTGRLLTGEQLRQKGSKQPAESSESVNNQFLNGDVLFGKLRPYLAKTWLADCDGTCTTELLVLSPIGIEARFLTFIFLWKGFVDSVDALTFGSKMPRADWDSIGDLTVPVPNPELQLGIADYLDRETARIDALIAAKQRLLTLLAEKRQALITRAVTRGLDPNVPLRDSGIPWLGPVPSHWQATRVKFVAQVRGGITLGKVYGAGPFVELPYIRVANVQDGHLDLSDVTTIQVPSSEAALYLLQNGDVLMNEGGDADKLGRGCVWREEITPCLHQNHVFAVRPKHVLPDWLDVWTSSSVAKAYFESRARQSTNLASISASNVKELPIPLPPTNEQKAIVFRVNVLLEKLDGVRATTIKTLALLTERRSALIAAAVTGQISIPSETPA
jgi:type I restriction enzyme S subunit